MKRFFTLVLGALALVAVALISAFIAMRLAIHGREVAVPNLAGLTVAEATKLASRDGLNLTLENRFYATDVPAGRILAQEPAAGSHVRRDWAVRITESLGSQRVSIPDLTGQSERAATVSIRRLSLDPGVVAHLPIPGDPDVVLAQTPPANSGGVDGPRLSLLVSDPADAAPQPAYVTPSLIGLPFSTAAARAATAGLRLTAIADAPPAPDPTAVPTAAVPPAAAPATPPPAPTPTPAPPDASAPPAHPTGTITAQTPQPGRRIAKGDVIRVTLAHPTPASPPATPAP
jgi:eukaryotic-like serine/threonine-protein kinase